MLSINKSSIYQALRNACIQHIVSHGQTQPLQQQKGSVTYRSILSIYLSAAMKCRLIHSPDQTSKSIIRIIKFIMLLYNSINRTQIQEPGRPQPVLSTQKGLLNNVLFEWKGRLMPGPGIRSNCSRLSFACREWQYGDETNLYHYISKVIIHHILDKNNWYHYISRIGQCIIPDVVLKFLLSATCVMKCYNDSRLQSQVL